MKWNKINASHSQFVLYWCTNKTYYSASEQATTDMLQDYM